MGYYELQPEFWKEFMTIMGAVLLLMVAIPVILRRAMGADKKIWFSYNHINDFHKKGDWALRISFMISLIAGVISFRVNLFIVLFISGLFSVSQLGFQAYVEWKFTENRNNYKVTIAEIGLTFIAFSGVLLWLEI